MNNIYKRQSANLLGAPGLRLADTLVGTCAQVVKLTDNPHLYAYTHMCIVASSMAK